MYGFLLRSERFETDARGAPSHPVISGIFFGVYGEVEVDDLSGPLGEVYFDGGGFCGCGRELKHARSVDDD